MGTKKAKKSEPKAVADKGPLLDRFRDALKLIGEREKKHPREITCRNLRRHADTNVSEYEVTHSGYSFTELRDQAYPPEPHPFREYKDLDHGSLQEIIAEAIKHCAEDKEVEPHEMTWDEFRRYIGFRYGTNDVGIERDAITKAGGFNAVRDAFFPLKATPNTVNKVRTQETARINRRLGREDSQHQFIFDRIEEYARNHFAKKFSFQICCSPKATAPASQTLLLVLSDLHYGADIKSIETGLLNYGSEQEARRTAQVIRETVSYDPANRVNTKLVVLIIGDIIQGQLHDPRDGAVIAEQWDRAVHNLAQALAYLSGHFMEVEVHIEPGNHDRIASVHPKRAINGKWNSYMWMIGSALKWACHSLPNVTFNMPKTPYVMLEIFGHNIFATHGDGVINVGHETVSIGGLEKQTGRLNELLPGGKKFDYFISGHIHRGQFIALQNGCHVVTNASITPNDQYAVSLGAVSSNCGQWLLVFKQGTKGAIQRLIPVGYEQDKDESLDAIITPWVAP